MCSSGPDTIAQNAIATQQVAAQKELSANQLAEQQREFDATQKQAADTLANQKALQDANQAEVDRQAALTKQWQTGRADAQAKATTSIDSAFGQFTPDYYKKYISDYTAHYNPLVDQQAGQKSNQTLFGLARSGNLQSSTAAEQIGQNAQDTATAKADIANAATAASQALQSNVANAKQNLMAQATSEATIGSPITPGSADAITANFNNTATALSRITNQAGDVSTTLAATPNYGGLGSLFGAAASGLNAGLLGRQSYLYGQAFNGYSGGAANPTGARSFGVTN